MKTFKFQTDYNRHVQRKTDCSKGLNTFVNTTVETVSNKSDKSLEKAVETVSNESSDKSLEKEIELLKSKLQNTESMHKKEMLELKNKLKSYEDTEYSKEDIESYKSKYESAVSKYLNLHMFAKPGHFQDIKYYLFYTDINVTYEQFEYYMDNVKVDQLYGTKYSITHLKFAEKKDQLMGFLDRYIKNLDKSENQTLYGKKISKILIELNKDTFALDKKFPTILL
jgi:hypothetical protein